jgi:hypothetical protein
MLVGERGGVPGVAGGLMRLRGRVLEVMSGQGGVVCGLLGRLGVLGGMRVFRGLGGVMSDTLGVRRGVLLVVRNVGVRRLVRGGVRGVRGGRGGVGVRGVRCGRRVG